MLHLDTAKRPIRPSDWAAVLQAIYNAQPSDEQQWLEWKSTLDLRSKEHLATIVPKAIIGFANRDPSEASANVGGIGILVIGLEPGNAAGVAPVDNADLDKLVSTYVGADGPVWQPHWDQFNGVTILIIEIEAPRWGDPIHSFRKTFTPIAEGTIYVRKRARTEPANTADINRLAERFKRQTIDSLAISVTVELPRPIARYSTPSQAMDDYIAAEHARLIAPLAAEVQMREAAKKREKLGIPDLSRFDVMAMPERRSPREYMAEVSAYENSIRQNWQNAVAQLAARQISPPLFRVTNHSIQNYAGLRVKLHIEGDVLGVKQGSFQSERTHRFLLPKAPRLWGPTRFGENLVMPLHRAPGYVSPPANPSTRIERNDGLMLTFPAIDLRPMQSEILESEICLLESRDNPGPVPATWEATATNVNALARGDLDIRFDGGVVVVELDTSA